MPTTGDDLTEVLMEFAQRVHRERKLGSGIPPPFEVTSTVVQLGSSKFPESTRIVSDDTVQQQAMVAPETEYNLGAVAFLPVPGNQFQQVMNFAGHNPGRIVTNPLYIRVRSASWAIAAPGWPPPSSGIMSIGFGGFLPPPYPPGVFLPPQLPNFVTIDFGMSLIGLPPITPGLSFIAVLQVTLFIQDSVTGEYAETIFGTWPFTPGNPGYITLDYQVTLSF